MAMKTYSECEQAVKADLIRAAEYGAWHSMEPADRMSSAIGYLQAKCVELSYENELLRNQSNTREMHQLYERLGGKCETAADKVS